MDNFAAVTVIVLVGMAIPIVILLGAIVFDVGVLVYALIRYVRDRMRRHLAATDRGQAARTAGDVHEATHPMAVAGKTPA